MSYLHWHIGDIRIARIVEIDASSAVQEIIQDANPADISRASWLTPDYVDDSGHLRGVVQSFLIELNGVFVIVDTCVGNKKRREGQMWDDLHTDFLARLAQGRVPPDEVGHVICTHLHFDHVGWNTQLVDGVWRPTFPNARYTVSEGEFRYWQSRPASEVGDHHSGFADSVMPVAEAGLLHLVPDDQVVTDAVRLVPSPGHTPHHVSVLLESKGQTVLITGDAMHHPCQIAYPDWGTISDFNPQQARASRIALLERFVDSDTLIIGSHFTDPGIGLLRQGTAGYYLAPAAL